MESQAGQATHVALLSPSVGTPNVGDHFVEMAIRRLLRDDVVYHRFTVRRPLTTSELDAINATTCALVCGTNLYQHDWHSALTPGIVSRIRVPVVPFGVGGSARRLDEIEVSDTTREMIRMFHSRCALGSVRDPHGARVVAHAGVENAILTGCPVLFWGRQRVLPPVLPAERRRVVVTARNWLMHRWPDNVNHPVQINFLRTVLASFPPDQLVFAVHEDWDEQLVDLLDIPRPMVFRSERPEEYVSIYSNPENVILAMRLHAGLLAVANGVPAVFVGHDTRTYSGCNMMGLDYVELFEETCADECVERLRRIMDGDAALFAGLQARYERLRKAMAEFLEANSLPACALDDPA